MRDLFNATISRSNELLACFLAEKDDREYRDCVDGRFSPYFMLQIMTVTKPGGVPHDQFAQFVSSLEQQFGAQFDTFWKSMEGRIEAGEESSAAAPTRHLGKDVQVRLGQRAPIETSRESEDLCISVWMTDATFDIGGKSVTSLQVQTSAALYVNGRLLVIFGYRTYENESDVTALKDPTRSWADRIAASNERPSD